MFERQVQVFEFLLGRRELDGGAQLWRQLALFVDALEHGGTAVFQLTQVAQTRFQFAQLDIVQPVSGFFAIASDKRHGCPAIEKLDCSFDLVFADLDFGGELTNDFLHG